jgi:CheY-like chemotaxis protein
MESGRQTYEVEKVPIDLLVREAFALYKVQSPLHAFHLDLQTDQTMIQGDREKLRQVMMNLISNAVKYSPNGGDVRVVCRQEGNRLVLAVQDEGLGIPAEAVSLPLPEQPSPGARDALPDNSDNQPGGMRSKGQVIIIEDDVNLSQLLRDELTSSGFRVHSYSKVAEAMKAIEEMHPDAVVLDLVLQGGENGWEVIESMRDNPKLATIPIVISSAFEEKKKAFDLGAKGYLIKPYHPDTLSKAILLAITSNEPPGQILVPDEIKES